MRFLAALAALLFLAADIDAATPVGLDTVLPVQHSYLDTNSNPEALATITLRVVDGSSNVLDTITVPAAASPGPTDVPLAGLLDFPGASGSTVTLEARVADVAGNDSAWAVFGQITVDDVPPATPTFGVPFDGSP